MWRYKRPRHHLKSRNNHPERLIERPLIGSFPAIQCLSRLSCLKTMIFVFLRLNSLCSDFMGAPVKEQVKAMIVAHAKMYSFDRQIRTRQIYSRQYRIFVSPLVFQPYFV